MAIIDREIEQAVAAEQVRVLEAVRWAFAAYDGDLDKIAQHCFGMSFEWTRRLRDEELDQARQEATKAERERIIMLVNGLRVTSYYDATADDVAYLQVPLWARRAVIRAIKEAADDPR